MRSVLFPISLLLVVLALGCASVERRIEANREAFDSYPPEVQATIRRGEVAVGFTEEQVLMALGEPDRKAKVTAEDRVAYVWTWRKSTPGFGFGFGTGRRVGGVGIGTGISTGSSGTTEDEHVVEFVDGRVTAFEMQVED
jgi:hypothetical protein